jgi:hypothetical protein
MVRFLSPYFVVALAIAAAGGAAYGTEAIGVPAFYAALLLGGAVASVGYVRWEQRHHRHR